MREWHTMTLEYKGYTAGPIEFVPSKQRDSSVIGGLDDQARLF